MDEKEGAPDLEFLNQLFEAGNDQIRRTFDLYLELVDKFKELEDAKLNKEISNGQSES